MTTIEPLLPHPGDDDSERIPAADPGPGGPAPAPGFGIGGEEPDRTDAEERPAGDLVDRENPFRTPTPPQD